MTYMMDGVRITSNDFCRICGQNIAMSSGHLTITQVIASMWAGERKDFKYGVDTGKVVGHYTQLVWRTTTEVGCATKLCNAGTPRAFHFWVCNYLPAGNSVPTYVGNRFKPY
jgi:pathogenesis-related protein 1